MSLGGTGTELDIVIPTFRGVERLRRCLPLLLAQLRPGDAVYVVDDCSGDGTDTAIMREFPSVGVIVRPVNGGFACAVNTGMAAGTNPVVALLNDDCVVDETWRVAVGQALADQPQAGSIACQVRQTTASDTIDSAGLTRDRRGFVQRMQGEPVDLAEHSGWVLGPAGSAAVYRRSALEVVGSFDESLGSYYEDVDLALRLQQHGFRCWYQPQARVSHEGGASFEHYSERHVRLCVRNQLLVLTTNVPASALLRIVPGFAIDQLRSGASLCVKHGRSRAWFAGVLGYLRMLPGALTTRATRVRTYPSDYLRHIDFLAP